MLYLFDWSRLDEEEKEEIRVGVPIATKEDFQPLSDSAKSKQKSSLSRFILGNELVLDNQKTHRPAFKSSSAQRINHPRNSLSSLPESENEKDVKKLETERSLQQTILPRNSTDSKQER